MKKVLIIFGTRPEAVKMAPLIREFRRFPQEFNLRVCVTAQHREILDQVLEVFKISPDYDLDIMQDNQDLYDISANVLLKTKEVLDDFEPDLVLVHGDTTTTFTASLAAYYKQIDVGHVEAGLRTNDIYSPFPEEINRQLTTRLTRYHFAPTILNRQNLLNENIREDSIVVTGNTVIDALLQVLTIIEQDEPLKKSIIETVERFGYPLTRLLPSGKLLLVTGHRRENFGQAFLDICEALKEIAVRHPDVDIVYPVHLNPNVRTPVYSILSQVENIYLIEPVDYLSFVYLMNRSYLILTDSGGIQEEAPSLAKPTLVMRNLTERPEAVEAGTAELVGTSREKIIDTVTLLLTDEKKYQQMARAHNPYGDGRASERIVGFLRKA